MSTSVNAEVVAEGVAALRLFGDDLTRIRARVLLSMWRGAARLSAEQREAVLSHFPEARVSLPAVLAVGFLLVAAGIAASQVMPS